MAEPDLTTPLLPRSLLRENHIDRSASSRSNDRLETGVIKPQQDEEAGIDTSPEPALSTTSVSVGRIVCVLLIGSFMSSADGSLMYATHSVIASEFDALHDSSWLIASFALAQAVSQPIYGKLSDIYGRKAMLVFAYTLFAIGMVLSGMGQSMAILIVGRVISGAGSSGMTSLVSILITDLVPLRDVATWRSYVNIASTTGRSIGGPLGGWAADTIGWRWSFLGQAPIAGVAMLLIALTLPRHADSKTDVGSRGSKLSRIDFLGATCMTLSILGLLLPLEIGGDRIPWSSPKIVVLLLGAFFFGLAFLAVEKWVAKEPMVPLPLLRHRDVVTSCFVMLFQCAAQTTLMFAVPLYFQITSNASNAAAGAHLIPAVVGNASAGIISGTIIKRTGRYKRLAIFATLSASCGFSLLIVRWHGHTNWLESLYIFPCGFAMGTMLSSLFISIQAGVEPAYAAISASMLYLTQPTGNVIGLAVASALLQGRLRQGLDRRLDKMGYAGGVKYHIIEEAVSNVHFVDKATKSVAKAVVGSYIDALTSTHILSLVFTLVAFVGATCLRQHKL
ncbi:major facilitator superfamily domain-containing protein [Phaeosphaeria sp. MPI-PUGE-AT-0046c]|nr:major facilitator superfamily domain-containing protein [Phaeosphaeria sp. MPI-PUGE-AT-0046c]